MSIYVDLDNVARTAKFLSEAIWLLPRIDKQALMCVSTDMLKSATRADAWIRNELRDTVAEEINKTEE
jgi:hypothetical protein